MRMTGVAWADGLLAEVDRAFIRTGANTPGWPDPHPHRSPLDEEYSRLTDVAKYRILDARVAAWVEVLTERDIAVADSGSAELWIGGLRPPTDYLHVCRLAPSAPGGLRLLLATAVVDGEPFPLDIGIASPGLGPVLLEMVPDCGCDACDSGSTDLLRSLDECVLTVVRGGVIHAARGTDTATRTWDGWSMGNGADLSWLDEATPADTRIQRWVGSPWV